MRTKLDYVKKQIDAGLFEVGAVIDVAFNKRSWVPFVDHQKNIASLAERVDRIMDQQELVGYMVCISGDFRQIGVLYTLPQAGDLLRTGGVKRNGSDELKALATQVGKQLLDAGRTVKGVLSAFTSGKDQSIQAVGSKLHSAENPNVAKELLRQTRGSTAVIELAAGKIRIGGARDEVPERLFEAHDSIIEFIPTRGVDERDVKARGNVSSVSGSNSIAMGEECSFSLQTKNDMQAIKVLELAQLNHRTVKCEVRISKSIQNDRTIYSITQLLNVNDLIDSIKDVQLPLFDL